MQSVSQTAPQRNDTEDLGFENEEKQIINVSLNESAKFYFSLDWEDKFNGDFVSDESFSNFLTGVNFQGNYPLFQSAIFLRNPVSRTREPAQKIPP